VVDKLGATAEEASTGGTGHRLLLAVDFQVLLQSVPTVHAHFAVCKQIKNKTLKKIIN
jgi:hypothetical protein